MNIEINKKKKYIGILSFIEMLNIKIYIIFNSKQNELLSGKLKEKNPKKRVEL